MVKNKSQRTLIIEKIIKTENRIHPIVLLYQKLIIAIGKMKKGRSKIELS
jgi:hypothetical protein